jgi:acetyltransferase-like isoleucine patch superfamily enzyme
MLGACHQKEETKQIVENSKGIFHRLKTGESVPMNDPEYSKIMEVVNRTIKLSQQLNTADNTDEVRNILSEIIGIKIDSSTTIFPPFYTNFGKFIQIGKNVFINHACTFLDMGKITIKDDVLIAPKVNIITENHPVDPRDRKVLVTKPITIKNNAWIDWYRCNNLTGRNGR